MSLCWRRSPICPQNYYLFLIELLLFILMKYFKCIKVHKLKNTIKTITQALSAASEMERGFFNEKMRVI